MIFITEGGCQRIKNAALKINRNIYLVGSRASNTATMDSDFDYIIPEIKNREWKKIKNSLPGSKNIYQNIPDRIDLLKGRVDFSKPYIVITSNPYTNECR